MSELKSTLLMGCFLRTYLVGAAYNPRGLQNIGFTFVIEPALAALYGSGKKLRDARLRYARNYNCHPFFTPMLLGIFLRMEAEIAAGRLNPAVHESIKDTTANTLSAIGDSLFNGTALNTWAVAVACLVLAGLPLAAVALTVALFVLLQCFKIATFILALRKGLAVLFFLRRFDLINWGDRFKYVNALLLTLFLCLALPGASALSWGGVGLYLLLAGWVVGRLHVSRVFVALFLLAVAVALHLSDVFPDIPRLFFGMSGA